MLARLPLWCWFVAGALAVATVQIVHVGLNGWNPTVLLQVGSEYPGWHIFAGDFPDLRSCQGSGHDGKYN